MAMIVEKANSDYDRCNFCPNKAQNSPLYQIRSSYEHSRIAIVICECCIQEIEECLPGLREEELHEGSKADHD